MKLKTLILAVIFLFPPTILATETCPVGENRYRPGGDCESTSPQRPHREVNDYSLSCIPASSITYKQVTTDPKQVPNKNITVDLTVDLTEAELGGFGPNSQTINNSSPDFLAQNYPFNSLFDRPTNNSAFNNRESFRTWWRLLSSREQATAKAVYLDKAKPHIINFFLKLLPRFEPRVSMVPIISFLLNYSTNLAEIDLPTAWKLFTDLSKTFTLNIKWDDVKDAIENKEIYFTAFMNNNTISYYNSSGQKKEMTTIKLADRLDKLFNLFPGCLRKIPVCSKYTKKYQQLDQKTKDAYDALIPFNLDNLQSFLVLDKTIVTENIPYINAINDGLNDRRTGLAFILSPAWAQDDIKNNITIADPIALLDLGFNGRLKDRADDYNCQAIASSKLTNLPAPKTFPDPTTLTQKIVFENLTTDKKLLSSTSTCKGGFFCTSLSKTACDEQTFCTWTTTEKYEYTTTGQGEGEPIVVFNHPFVANIANSIVSGNNSLFKMLLPQFATTPDERTIDAPNSTFTVSSSSPNSTVTVTTSNGSSGMPIYRKTGLIKDSLCLLQNKWFIPAYFQRSNDCDSL